MERLLAVMRRLRGPEGCPWDRAQTHQSLRPYLLEEAAEAVDAIGEGDPRAIAEELGDVLLQVAFHAVIAEESGTFDYPQVETLIVEKLIRRHPHVFGDAKAETPEAVATRWEAIKAAEGKAQDQIPRALGALARATAIQEKLGTPPAHPQEVVEALAQDNLAEALWRMVALCRERGVNPEVLLRERCNQAS